MRFVVMRVSQHCVYGRPKKPENSFVSSKTRVRRSYSERFIFSSLLVKETLKSANIVSMAGLPRFENSFLVPKIRSSHRKFIVTSFHCIYQKHLRIPHFEHSVFVVVAPERDAKEGGAKVLALERCHVDDDSIEGLKQRLSREAGVVLPLKE